MALYGSRLFKTGLLCKHAATRAFSASSVLSNDKVYELRTYALNAKDFKTMLDLSVEKLHLRTQHSKLIGYWVIEQGALNAVTHIWEYDSLAHRASVRAKLAGDSIWISEYFGKLLGYIHLQNAETLKALPGVVVQSEAKGYGAYELRRFTVNPAQMTQDNLKSLASSGQQSGDGQLMGAWNNVFGDRNTVYQLWAFKTLDDSFVNLKVEGNDQKVLDAAGVSNINSKLLVPCAWSPLQ